MSRSAIPFSDATATDWFRVSRDFAAPRQLSAGLGSAMQERSSHREFSERPVPLNDLKHVLFRMAMFAAEFSSLLSLDMQVRLGALIREGDGRQALWYGHRNSSLIPAGPTANHRLSQFQDVPCVVYICGPLDHVVADQGVEGYRKLITLAGATLTHGWLHAVDRGLVGCLFGRGHQSEFAQHFKAHPIRERQLVALTLGYASTRRANERASDGRLGQAES